MNVWRDFDGAVTNRSRDARQAGFVSLNPSKKSGEVIRKTGISDVAHRKTGLRLRQSVALKVELPRVLLPHTDGTSGSRGPL